VRIETASRTRSSTGRTGWRHPSRSRGASPSDWPETPYSPRFPDPRGASGGCTSSRSPIRDGHRVRGTPNAHLWMTGVLPDTATTHGPPAPARLHGVSPPRRTRVPQLGSAFIQDFERRVEHQMGTLRIIKRHGGRAFRTATRRPPHRDWSRKRSCRPGWRACRSGIRAADPYPNG
jgi:hypothetical protein